MKIQLKNVRLSFPDLFVAKAVNGEGEPKFGASFLLPLAHPQLAEINAAIDKVGAEKFGPKAAAVLASLRASDKTCLHDGGTKSYDGYEGQMFISARNAVRPLVLDANKAPLTAADGKPYSGCYVNAVVELWAQDNKFGKRVNASITGVQFLRDGDAFTGGGTASADEFDDVAEGATADDLV